MIRTCIAFCLAMAAFSGLQAQTLRIRSNSLENLHIAAVGVDKDGHYTTKTYYDLNQDQWKVVSLYEAKYGYDKYDNKEMQHEGLDATAKWQKLIIYDASNTVCDVLDLTKTDKRASLGHAHIWAKVKQSWDRNYLIPDVTLNDD